VGKHVRAGGGTRRVLGAAQHIPLGEEEEGEEEGEHRQIKRQIRGGRQVPEAVGR
jgi:hypothetical protein